jgi:hypothetical protein
MPSGSIAFIFMFLSRQRSRAIKDAPLLVRRVEAHTTPRRKKAAQRPRTNDDTRKLLRLPTTCHRPPNKPVRTTLDVDQSYCTPKSPSCLPNKAHFPEGPGLNCRWQPADLRQATADSAVPKASLCCTYTSAFPGRQQECYSLSSRFSGRNSGYYLVKRSHCCNFRTRKTLYPRFLSCLPAF